jgi:hypothetical protein
MPIVRVENGGRFPYPNRGSDMKIITICSDCQHAESDHAHDGLCRKCDCKGYLPKPAETVKGRMVTREDVRRAVMGFFREDTDCRQIVVSAWGKTTRVGLPLETRYGQDAFINELCRSLGLPE